MRQTFAVTSSNVIYQYAYKACNNYPSTGILANGSLLAVDSYSTCSNSATLSAIPGFLSFLWQGPAGSNYW